MHRYINISDIISEGYSVDEMLSYRLMKHSESLKRNVIEFKTCFTGTKLEKMPASLELFLILSIFHNKDNEEIVDPFSIIDLIIKNKKDTLPPLVYSLSDIFDSDELEKIATLFINKFSSFNNKSHIALTTALSDKKNLFEKYKNKFFVDASEYHEGQINSFFYQLKRLLEFRDDRFDEKAFFKILQLNFKTQKEKNYFSFKYNLK